MGGGIERLPGVLEGDLRDAVVHGACDADSPSSSVVRVAADVGEQLLYHDVELQNGCLRASFRGQAVVYPSDDLVGRRDVGDERSADRRLVILVAEGVLHEAAAIGPYPFHGHD